MGSSCCNTQAQSQQKKNILITVLILNAVMFFGQFSAAFIGHSTSLLADSLDMLGDALTYSVSLYALGKSSQWLARAALFKGVIIILFSLGIIAEAIIKATFIDVFPHVGIMTIFSILGLVVNGTCFYLLTRHRNADINMRSTWICARNDIIGNITVLLAAGFVYALNSRWPDIIIGLALAALLLKSAWGIILAATKANKVATQQ